MYFFTFSIPILPFLSEDVVMEGISAVVREYGLTVIVEPSVVVVLSGRDMVTEENVAVVIGNFVEN